MLASGGLDSAVLIATLARRYRVHPLYVRCGLVWERAEQILLRRFLATARRWRRYPVAPMARIDLPIGLLYGGDHWSVSGRGVPGRRAGVASNYLPGRNLLLGSVGAVYSAQHGIPSIAMALLAGNPFRDASPAFLRSLGRVASDALGRRITIRAPFRRLTKAAVIRRGRDLRLDLTLSCARPRGLRHCGRCTKCAERRRGFIRAGVVDPTAYAATQ